MFLFSAPLSRVRVTIATLAYFLTAVQVVLGEEPSAGGRTGGEVTRSFDEACKLFAPIVLSDVNALQEFQFDERDDVALVASWEILRRSYITETQNGVTRRAYVPTEQLARHVGFIEGRLQVRVPDEWRKALASIRVQFDERGDLSFGFSLGISRMYDGWIMPDYIVPFWLDSRESVDLPASANVSSLQRMDDGALVAIVDERRVRLSAELLNTITGEEATVSYLCLEPQADQWLVGVVNAAQDEASVAMIDQQATRVMWKHALWSPLSGFRARSFGGPHFVEMVVTKQSVYVFGAAHQALYIEKLSLKDGTLSTRFGTYLASRFANSELKE